MLYTLYRISDKGNNKTKLGHANKLYCLKNYINVFGKEMLIVFADNCKEETIGYLDEIDIKFIILNDLGNDQSFISVLDYAIANFEDDDSVYFLEDDYLHLENAKKVLLEGLELADYVTLYDNPDKYINFHEGGSNHFILDNGEESRVLLTGSSHWKITNSTTMTFSCKVKTLKEDYKVWSFYKVQDYLAFQRLINCPLKFKDQIKVIKNKLTDHINYLQKLRTIYQFYKNIFLGKKRVLIVSIPGKATHIETDYLSPLTNWQLI